mgnify:CR=1 FL=1
MYRKLICIFTILTSQIIMILLGGAYYLANQAERNILPGIRVQGIPLGDMTKEEALSKLKQRLDTPDKNKLLITANDQEWDISYQEIGINIDYQKTVDKAFTVGRNGGSVKQGLQALRLQYLQLDIPVSYTFQNKKLRNKIIAINDNYKQSPQNARLLLQNKNITMIKHREGRRINIGATIEKIKEGYLEIHDSFPAVIETIDPQVKASDLSSINSILGECETKFNPYSPNRVTNLELASQKINNTLLRPGEVFSFNQLVGKRDKKSGYKNAPIISNTNILSGLGGGICQVSTTLYDAVLLANLHIVERYPHSMAVGYVTPGLDATVAYGYKDFKFKNTYDNPIYILSSLQDNRLSVIILGRQNNNNTSVKLTTKINKIVPNVVVKKTSTLETGLREVKYSGSPGYKVEVFRILIKDGNEISKEHISSEYYPPRQRIVLEGLGKGEGEKV